MGSRPILTFLRLIRTPCGQPSSLHNYLLSDVNGVETWKDFLPRSQRLRLAKASYPEERRSWIARVIEVDPEGSAVGWLALMAQPRQIHSPEYLHKHIHINYTYTSIHAYSQTNPYIHTHTCTHASPYTYTHTRFCTHALNIRMTSNSLNLSSEHGRNPVEVYP